MNKSVYSTKVDEYTIRSNVLNSTFENLTFFELANNFFLLCFKFSFNESLMRNNNIAEFLVDFYNLEFHCFSYEYVVVTNRMNVDLTSRQESLNAKYVNNHTALSATFDVTLYHFFAFKRSVYTVPALV